MEDQFRSMSETEPLPEEIREASAHPNGWVYRIAGSYPEGEAVPPEAIVGAWKVDANGRITGAFISNPRFKAPPSD